MNFKSNGFIHFNSLFFYHTLISKSFYFLVIDMIHPGADDGGEGGHGSAGPANSYGGVLPRDLEEVRLGEIHLIQIS